MVAKKSPRTPRGTASATKKTPTKVQTPTPTRPSRPSRPASRKSLVERSDSEPDSDSEAPEPGLKGQTSPYFSKSKKLVTRDVGASINDKRKKPVKDPRDVTGLTETESDDTSEDDSGDDDVFAAPDEDSVGEDEEDEEVGDDSGDSDDFDTPKSKKRKVASGKSNGAKGRTVNGSAKKGKQVRVDGYEDEDELDEVELEEGQELAGRIYPAPKTGQVPPGRISQNTLNFLKNLQIPERNDREWFRSHEPAFRQAENEWKAFVGTVQLKMQEADDELPLLPPKDVIHRIYRDVRFSSDKTPYKRSFSLSTSRSGRKGLWAGYHLSLCPNDKSILACGVWCPAKDELATIRHHILSDASRLRDVISAEEFVDMFGPAKPHKDGKRQNVYGHDDALKIAPKLPGVDKDHKDIDLLKLRTVAVVHHWTDEEVLKEDFQDEVRRVMTVMRPFVHLINEFIALPP